MSKPRSGRRVAIVVIVVVVAAVGAILLARPKKARYRTSVVQTGDISVQVSATGTVNPVREVVVGSQVSGTLEKVYVDFNDHVTQGQVLATIDPRNYNAALAQAQANLSSARASLDQAVATAVRAESLYANQLISNADLVSARTDREVAQAHLEQAQAGYDQAQTNLAYTTITSPMTGTVVNRNVEDGQTVAASLQAPNLFTIADLSGMQVEVSIDEADVGKLDTGLAVTFNVDAYPESTFEGTLVQVRNEPIVSSNVTTYTGIARVGNPGLLLKPGMTANVKILVRGVTGVLTVPNAALSSKLASTLGLGRKPNARASGGQGTTGMGAVGQGAAASGQGAAFAGPGPGRRWGARPTGGFGAGGGRGQHRHWQPGATAAAGDSSRTPAPGDSGRMPARPDTTAMAGAATATAKTVYVLERGRPVAREVEIGMADGSNTEVRSGLKEGELVIIGLGQGKSSSSTGLGQNRMPMMGGFGGPPPGGR